MVTFIPQSLKIVTLFPQSLSLLVFLKPLCVPFHWSCVSVLTVQSWGLVPNQQEQ